MLLGDIIFGKKVVIKIKLGGKDLKDIQNILSRIHGIAKKNFTPEFMRHISPPTPGRTDTIDASYAHDLYYFSDAVEKAKFAAHKLKNDSTLNIESQFFKLITELIHIYARPLLGSNFRGVRVVQDLIKDIYILAKFFDDLIQRVILEEVEFIGQLKKDIQLLEESGFK